MAVLWVVGAAIVLILALAQPRARRWRTVVIGVILTVILAATALGVAVWGLHISMREIPLAIVVACSLTILSVLLGTSAVISNFRRVWVILPLCVSVVVSLLVANGVFGLYPNSNSIDPPETYRYVVDTKLPEPKDPTPLSEWKTRNFPTRFGSMSTISVPNAASSFKARPSQIYLPPAYYQTPTPQLPVLVLMAGTPGSPTDWFDRGRALQAVDEYQRTHRGIAPIILSVDATGSQFGNPLCVDSPLGNVQTYLTEDVPAWLEDRFAATPDHSQWTIGGLSYGGTCAFQMATQRPDVYSNFLDFSGERTLNDGNTHATTVTTYFGGSEERFKHANPEDVLAHRRFPDTHGLFVSGEKDATSMTQLPPLNDRAQKAGMKTSFLTIPYSGHDYTTWAEAFNRSFPSVITWSGLPH